MARTLIHLTAESKDEALLALKMMKRYIKEVIKEDASNLDYKVKVENEGDPEKQIRK